MSDSFKSKAGTEIPLLNLRGKSYLEVKHRIQWFREEHPDWSVEAEFIFYDEHSAFAKATIKDKEGRIIASAHKFENVEGFADFREKAETGAVGRALALIGYGTQFAMEMDEGERIVDAPVAKVSPIAKEKKWDFPVRKSWNEGPICCQKPMMTSKYDENSWFCTVCRSKREKS